MAGHTTFEELRKRLRRVDLLLLRAVRRMRGRPQNTSRGEHWGALITDDDVDELLREAGEISGRVAPNESERRLAQALLNAEAVRDAPGLVMDPLRAQHALDGLDVDILLLALAPDVYEGYGRILAFLNDYAVMPWATVDLISRVIATRRVDRLRVLERFLPGAPLMRDGLLVLHPLDPAAQPFAWRRVQVARGLAAHLLGQDEEVDEPAEAEVEGLAVVEDADDEASVDAERVEDTPSMERRSLFRDLVRKWRNFVSGPTDQRAEADLMLLDGLRAEAGVARAGPTNLANVMRAGAASSSTPPPTPGLSEEARQELSQRLRRADLLLLHAIRLHREQPWVAEAARGKELMNLSLITEREVQDLLLQRADPYLRGPSGVEALLAASLEQRSELDGRVGALARRCGLSGPDVDILLLALLPEISSGYRRIFQFLNSFLHEHLTVGLLTRLLGEDPGARMEVRGRLGPRAPLQRWSLVTLHPVFPAQDHMPSLRVALTEGLVHHLLGEGEAPGRDPGRLISFPGADT